ncbi:MAG: L,D-transpeptidase family protein [Novosphingobium sp.]|uniref:L,D-transpeptidase family protein n=1 Tax=Novosphingobium sp. TaxID=1874826 RepID=UPI001810E0B4|nr:L,D-transpeptidase family protein [Novosphingobium sp.]
MGLKLNAMTGMIAVFAAVATGAGALLVMQDDTAKPKAVPEAVAAKAPPPAPKPQDEGLVIKRILPIAGPIKYGEWHWDDKGVPAGPLVVTVDLDARVLSVFRGGYEIGATAVLLGTSEKPTPLGVFPVKWKDKDHYSSKYDSAPMPYTMNLTEDGVAIHGTKVEKGYASHGCIGVPNSFGAKLFAIAPVGTKVYITKGKMAKQGDSLI